MQLCHCGRSSDHVAFQGHAGDLSSGEDLSF